MSKNKVVLVTGGSRGIGASIVEYFAKFHYDVVINYRLEENIANQLKDLCETKYHIKALAICADVSNEEQVKNMVQQIMTTFGRIDVLVNNAGIAIDKEFFERTREDFLKTLEVNVLGSFLVSKYVSEKMLLAKQGKIIFISSTNAFNTIYPTSIDYDASKAALISLTKNMATLLAPFVNVNAVAPGWVNTEMNQVLDPEFLKEECQKILFRRFAEPEEIAKLVYFLASDDANYITGETIRIDGGMF